MKSLFVVAGLIGAVGLLAAAPASAHGSSVACSPAFLCRIVGVPGQAAADIVTAPGRAYQNIVTTYPERAYQNIVTTYPERAYQNIMTYAGTRVPGHRDGVPGRAFQNIMAYAATRDRQHPRAIRTCSRSGVTAVGWRSVVIVATRSLGFALRFGTRSPAPLWSIRRRGGRGPSPIWRVPSALWWFSASNPAGRCPFPRPRPGIC